MVTVTWVPSSDVLSHCHAVIRPNLSLSLSHWFVTVISFHTDILCSLRVNVTVRRVPSSGVVWPCHAVTRPNLSLSHWFVRVVIVGPLNNPLEKWSKTVECSGEIIHQLNCWYKEPNNIFNTCFIFSRNFWINRYNKAFSLIDFKSRIDAVLVLPFAFSSIG